MQVRDQLNAAAALRPGKVHILPIGEQTDGSQR
jgi:hypothetical protein